MPACPRAHMVGLFTPGEAVWAKGGEGRVARANVTVGHSSCIHDDAG